ncbi:MULTISPECIES: ribonuclease H-like domain-containing protein [Bacillus cereus group]|uniref:ribonuclease H-like domain-containing protein n=1 Tax=Bacillus cereus group sp. BfR-BA-01494 TaxID=2920362 RepID=UPI001298C616|nr:hypothetical protein [Bacillus thuringiensis]
MDMNQFDASLPADLRASVALPKQKDFKIVATSNALYSSHKVDRDYEKRIANHIAILNRDKVSMREEIEELIRKKEPVIYDGQRVMQLFHATSLNRGQENFEQFRSFAKTSNHYVFDIETYGDSQDRIKPYGISEISLNEYDKNGNLIKGTGFNGIVHQNNDVIDYLQDKIKGIKHDKYIYNSLSEWEKRSLVDLMRYSSYATGDDIPFSYANGEIKHHSIITSVFDYKDQVDHAKVVKHMDQYMPYMESGLTNMTKVGHSPKEAMQAIIKIMNENREKYFVSYNGNTFDMPVMRAYAQKLNLEIPKDVKHLDYLNVIRTAYMDSNDLKKQMNPEYNPESNPYGKDKLAAYRHVLGSDSQDSAHNATVDTDSTAELIAKSRNHILNEFESAHTLSGQGFKFHETRMTWNDAELRNGQILFTSGGVQAYRDGDESFKVKFDEEGNVVSKSSGFNKTVINSKSFYQFAGVHDMSDENEKKLAFRFFEPEKNEYSYIVRKGENAFSELQDFVQSRFYAWDNINAEQQREIKHHIMSDRARRKYDSFFSLDGAGKGLNVINGEISERGTKGFSGLKRMLENAKIMQEYLEGAGKNRSEKIEALVQQGYSRNQAKKELARTITTDNLINKMDFHSLWDDEKKKYVFNESEKDAFFKMYKRLIDEMPYLNETVQKIDEAFSSDIQRAASKANMRDRQAALKGINQKRDRALMTYQQLITDRVGSPEESRKLKDFEMHKLSFYDAEVSDNRSINFETVDSARSSIYGYAKRGVGEGDNRQALIKERLVNLVNNLESQGKIDTNQSNTYRKLITGSGSPWATAGEIAIDMRKNNYGKYEQTMTVPSMNGNENIKNLSLLENNEIIKQAIQDTENVVLTFHDKAIKGKKLELSEQLAKSMEILDRERFSRLRPNNLQALETIISSVKKNDPTKSITMAMDPNEVMKLFVYDNTHSTSVQNQLHRGVKPTNALELTMPLISDNGTHKIDGLTLNAHSYAVLDGKNVKMISSAEKIAQGYARKMSHIMDAANDGNYEEANKRARRTLRNETESMSGISRSMDLGANDTYVFANNQSDNLKQSHVKMANAMIEDLYHNGYQNGKNLIKLNDADFYEDVFTTNARGEKILRSGVSFDDIKMAKTYEMLQLMPQWSQEKLGVNLYTSGLKDSHVEKGILSLQDIREVTPYGHFFNHGRGNSVQSMNAHLIDEELEGHLASGRYEGVDRRRLLLTPRQREYEYNLNNTNKVSINMKTAYMTQEDFMGRIQEMFENKQGNKLLKELGYINPDGTIDYLKLPRLYEQQGILAEDVAEVLKVNGEKRFEKGKQFEWHTNFQNAELNQTVKPGDTLGYRIHDNGYQEAIRYEGTHDARIVDGIQGDKDIILQHKTNAFKLMLSGEKMTDTNADRRLIEAVTGSKDIVAIINPDVAKHKDFGMLMSGEARILSDYVGGMKKNNQRKSAINIIENGNIGLTWDDQINAFIDNSSNSKIETNAFEKVFSDLQAKRFSVKNVTSMQDNRYGLHNREGVRVGILEGIMSKVENYSKATDSSGRVVLGFDEHNQPIHGSYDGVKWGHREMGVLKGRGMEKTFEHVYQEMMKNEGKLTESQNLIHSLEQLGKEDQLSFKGISANEFDSLPEQYKDRSLYGGTVFSQNKVESLAERYGNPELKNKHGYWLELPSIKRNDGQEQKVTINLNGKNTPKEIDKIFIPFTNLDATNGDVHLRELQNHIANIYKKADAVTKAPSIEEAKQFHGQLQGAVSRYVDHSFKELTSSKGMLFDGVYKANMSTSASGLFKLMDLNTTMKLQETYGEGQYTVISRDMAQKMGLEGRLEAGKHMYTANVRYPTFHDGAMQFTKLIMSDDVKPGEIHTTSFSSMLQNADSDGDYSHIAVIDDTAVQKEWEQAHNRVETEFERRWSEHERKENDRLLSEKERLNDPLSERRFSGPSLQDVADDGTGHIGKPLVNTSEETASKIGKMTIGRASNLNLFLRQVADQEFSHKAPINEKIKEFGRGLEQKLIDAKHGAKPAGLEMIDAIYNNNWDLAKDIDYKFFRKDGESVGMFAKDFFLNEVAEELPMALSNLKKGLRSDGFKFGTSTGLSSDMGIQKLLDIMHGNVASDELITSNSGLGMFYKHQNIELPDGSQAGMTDISELHRTPMQQRSENKKSFVNNMRNAASEGVSGAVTQASEKISGLLDKVKNMSPKKAMFMGGALALGGITSYNILSSEKPVMHYNDSKPKDSESRKQEPVPAIAMPNDSYSSQNASISIQASGSNMDKEQMSHMVAQGMRDTGMSAGPTKITVNHNDNTQKLNRIWYRDKVQQNV